MIFSIYMKMYSPSHLQIGGFDELGALNNVTGNTNFKFIKTISNKSWKLKMTHALTFGNKSDTDVAPSWNGEERFAIAELSYPYIHMPMADFAVIADKINEFYMDYTGQALCVK